MLNENRATIESISDLLLDLIDGVSLGFWYQYRAGWFIQTDQ